MQLVCSETKLPNLMLKTRARQLLGSLPLDIVLPSLAPVDKAINILRTITSMKQLAQWSAPLATCA